MHLHWRNIVNYDELADKLISLETIDEPTKEKLSYPSGWEPGVIWDGSKGVVTTSTLTEIPTDWSDILRERGLDPEAYEVVGDTIKWTSYDGWKRDAPGD
jgi:hypothetical protein